MIRKGSFYTQSVGYRPWLFPGCVYHKVKSILGGSVIDPGCFQVAYTLSLPGFERCRVIDPGCFQVAYTGIRKPVSVIKFNTVFLLCLYCEVYNPYSFIRVMVIFVFALKKRRFEHRPIKVTLILESINLANFLYPYSYPHP